MKTTIINPLLVALVLLTLSVASLRAQSVPSLMNYQGRLTDSAGVPLSNGTYRVAFRLWNKQALDAGQQLVWGREYDVTVVESGAFSVILGSGGLAVINVPAPAVNDLAYAFGESNRFLGLTITRDRNGQPVSNPTEILPRQQILSAPFAIKAEVAATLVPSYANQLSPPGSVVAFAGVAAPDGWLLCNGQAVSRTTHSGLFSVIGIAFGAGDGTSTFNVPDLRGRVGVGAGQGTGLSNRSLGQTLGAETHTLTIAQMPSHSHQLTTMPADNNAPGGYSGGGWAGDPQVLTTTSTGGNAPHNIVQPSLVIHYIIKH